ncbi:APC family permease [Sporosarcina obsidiansis]|uniref:APC family permease n=1 Tax=Sporosarcina obsidiansis TaxID=2660748 RepID=UPI00129A933B|nr:APC family permease [Sporosarcina obsidiansis]
MQKTTELKRNLGFFSVFVIGLSLLTPSTVFTVFGIASTNSDGHVPAVYIFAFIAIMFTVLSYTHMVKVFPKAGSAYTYVQQTFNPNLGFLVGWGTLFDYLFLPMVYVLSIVVYMNPLFPSVPIWIWIVGPLLIMSLCNLFSVKIAVSFSAFLVTLQLIITGIFIGLLITYHNGLTGSGELFSIEPFISGNLSIAVILSGSVILAYTFVGFDAISTLAEETINPTKTLPRAMIALVIFLGILYTAITYFMQRSFPDTSVFSNPDSAAVEIAQQVGGMLFTSIFTGIIIASILVGGIAAQMSTSRLLFAMGRDNVFPRKIFGYLHPKSGIPVYNIIITAVVSLISLFLSLDVAASVISFGAFTAFTFVNLCVIMHFIINQKMRSLKALILYLAFPIIGLSFIGLMWYNIDKTALTLGIIWNAIGFIVLIFITKSFKKSAPSLNFSESPVN